MGLGHDMLYGVTAVLGAPVWGVQWLRAGKLRTDWRGRFGHVATTEKSDDTRPTLLLHAVSVGEVDAARLLVRELVERSGGGVRIVISVTTDTGFRRATELFGEAHTVVRYPLDFSRCVNRFLDAVQPTAVCLVELELWPNFTRACERRGIPLAVVNGRLSERSFTWYRRVRPLVQPMFRRLSLAAVQTPEYAQRFVALGTPPEAVHVTDTMKWDTAQLLDDVPGSAELARAMGIDRSRPIVVAGSTGPGEEKLLIDTCPKDAQLVLVPRRPERVGEVTAIEPDIVRRSQHPAGTTRPLDGRRLFVIDTIGELRQAYALADVVVVGRSFLGLYGSNMLEPIGLGKPVVIGPHHSDFQGTMDVLVAAEGIVVTAEPGREVQRLLADPAAAAALAQRGRAAIAAHQGATARHADMLLELMPLASAAGADNHPRPAPTV